jgi:hypothetical protein
MPVRLIIATARAAHGFDAEAAREACLGQIVSGLQERSVERLVLESRDDDRRDARTIIRTRRPEPPLVFEHRAPLDEPLLWVADGVAWAAGLGGEHLGVLRPVIDRTVDVRP